MRPWGEVSLLLDAEEVAEYLLTPLPGGDNTGKLDSRPSCWVC